MAATAAYHTGPMSRMIDIPETSTSGESRPSRGGGGAELIGLNCDRIGRAQASHAEKTGSWNESEPSQPDYL